MCERRVGEGWPVCKGDGWGALDALYNLPVRCLRSGDAAECCCSMMLLLFFLLLLGSVSGLKVSDMHYWCWIKKDSGLGELRNKDTVAHLKFEPDGSLADRVCGIEGLIEEAQVLNRPITLTPTAPAPPNLTQQQNAGTRGPTRQIIRGVCAFVCWCAPACLCLP